MRRGLLVSLLGVAALTGCASQRASGVVPWVNRPLPLYRTPSPKLIHYPTTASLCRAGQLRVSTGQVGAATGNLSEPLVFTNVGLRPCLLRGYPAVSAATTSRGRRTLHPRHGTFFGSYIPADLAPQHHVFLDFGTSSGCEGGDKPVVHYRHLVFTLPEGGKLSGGRASIFEQCGLAISEFGLPARYGPVAARPGTPGTLKATVKIAARLRAGTKELDYVVTLSNPTATRVRLVPCPGYTEGVYAPGVTALRSIALDCDSVHSVPADGHVDYAMRLALPHPLRAGIAKLGWSLDTANGPFAGRGLVVVKS